MKELSLILHNIRSTYNVGAILRTADCAGLHTVYLCGYTPDPIDRFGRKRADVAKAALGAEDVVSWQHCDSTTDLITKLQAQGIHVAALEQHAGSIDYRSFSEQGDVALVLGEEVSGIEEPLLEQCDSTIEISMRGKKESLNVSVATGVAVFRLVEQLA